MSEKSKNTPTKAGIYLAKSGTFKWFNLFVEITGTAPFLEAIAFNRMDRQVFRLDVADVSEWSDVLIDEK